VVSQEPIQLHGGVKAGEATTDDHHPRRLPALRSLPAKVDPHVAQRAQHQIGEAEGEQEHHWSEQRSGNAGHRQQQPAQEVERGQHQQHRGGEGTYPARQGHPPEEAESDHPHQGEGEQVAGEQRVEPGSGEGADAHQHPAPAEETHHREMPVGQEDREQDAQHEEGRPHQKPQAGQDLSTQREVDQGIRVAAGHRLRSSVGGVPSEGVERPAVTGPTAPRRLR